MQTKKIKIRYKHVFIYFCFKNLQNGRKRLSGYYITAKSRMPPYQRGCQSERSGWKGLANSWTRFSALLWLQTEHIYKFKRICNVTLTKHLTEINVDDTSILDTGESKIQECRFGVLLYSLALSLSPVAC